MSDEVGEVLTPLRSDTNGKTRHHNGTNGASENGENGEHGTTNGHSSESESEAPGQKGDADTLNRRRRRAISAESFDPYDSSCAEPAVAFHPKTQQELACLREASANILFFHKCEPEQLEVLHNAMFERQVTPGEIIIREGDDGDNFYVIESGEYQILKGLEQECRLTLKDAGYFGELALLYNCPRNATIRASTAGRLWCLDQKTFRTIVVTGVARKRAALEELLRSVQLFESLTDSETMNLADALADVTFEAEERIIREGEMAQTMYFIVDGEVSVRVKDQGTGEERAVETLHRGAYFGELALVMKRPRVASVYATSAGTKCAVLDIFAFERLLGPCVDIMRRNVDTYDAQRHRLGLHTITNSSDCSNGSDSSNGLDSINGSDTEKPGTSVK